jgi:hypothetical protein
MWNRIFLGRTNRLSGFFTAERKLVLLCSIA